MVKGERDELISEITKLFAKFEKSNEILGSRDTFIQQLNLVINQKNSELESRLENISRLIHKNEQLNTQLRVQK
jgi:hypothetical protein